MSHMSYAKKLFAKSAKPTEAVPAPTRGGVGAGNPIWRYLVGPLLMIGMASPALADPPFCPNIDGGRAGVGQCDSQGNMCGEDGKWHHSQFCRPSPTTPTGGGVGRGGGGGGGSHVDVIVVYSAF